MIKEVDQETKEIHSELNDFVKTGEAAIKS